ncbi:hypothetical protein TNCV_2538831 [Trichonephila clavipes]|nr:hypothetical protein TNCV_2538831 [Trichonephila clavipes]
MTYPYNALARGHISANLQILFKWDSVYLLKVCQYLTTGFEKSMSRCHYFTEAVHLKQGDSQVGGVLINLHVGCTVERLPYRSIKELRLTGRDD